MKELFLITAQISQENTCARVSFLLKLQASTKETKNTVFTEHFWTTASLVVKVNRRRLSI